MINFTCSVSSVFNGDNANYGKKNLTDGSDETCWQSGTQLPHAITCRGFTTPPQSLKIQFQGGFVSTHIQINNSLDIYPLDINEFQEFSLAGLEIKNELKLDLLKSSDFYGRIIIYHLQLL
jgi:hypothetical protein